MEAARKHTTTRGERLAGLAVIFPLSQETRYHSRDSSAKMFDGVPTAPSAGTTQADGTSSSSTR